jgi:serine/threonine protein kinase
VQQIGPYQALSELARGGMGAVYRAWDPSREREVAVKVLLAARPDPSDLERFRREALALARLDHPGIVAVLDSGLTQDGTPYIVLELLRGRSLQQRLTQEGPLPLEEVLALGAQLADALSYAHDHGVLHRDLKPANVLQDQDGRAILTDFGLARLTGIEGLSQTGEIMGTPHFMAPEQADGARQRIGAHTDVHGLGATLYALLTGEPPYEGDVTVNVLRRVLEDPPPSARQRRREIPQDLDALVRRCLAKTPAERPDTTAEVAAALAAIGSTTARPSPSRRATLAALALAAAGVATGAGVLLSRPASPPPTPPPAASEPSPAALPPRAARTEAGSPPWRLSTTERKRAAAISLQPAFHLQHGPMITKVTFSEEGWIAASSLAGYVIRIESDGTSAQVRGPVDEATGAIAGQIFGVEAFGDWVAFGRQGLAELLLWQPGADLRRLPLPDVPAGESPYGLQVADGQLYVACTDGSLHVLASPQADALTPLGATGLGKLVVLEVQGDLLTCVDARLRADTPTEQPSRPARSACSSPTTWATSRCGTRVTAPS